MRFRSSHISLTANTLEVLTTQLFCNDDYRFIYPRYCKGLLQYTIYLNVWRVLGYLADRYKYIHLFGNPSCNRTADTCNGPLNREPEMFSVLIQAMYESVLIQACTRASNRTMPNNVVRNCHGNELILEPRQI